MAGLVGYRFHPSDEELVNFYLRNKNLGNESAVKHAINEIDIYKFDPWDLPLQSKLLSDDRVWFFFCPRVSKFSNSKRTSRTTRVGFWKGTGVDRKVKAKKNGNVVIGTKKTLVFYLGRVPNGQRTDWVIHEYQSTLLPLQQRTFVLCKVKDKKGEKTGISSCSAIESSYSLASEANNLAAINTGFEVNQPVQETTESFREHGLSVSELAVQPSGRDGLFLAELEFPNEIISDYNVQQPSGFLTEAELELLKAGQPSWLEGNEFGSDYFPQLPSDLLTEPHLDILNGSENVDGRFVEEQYFNMDDVILDTSVHEHFNHYQQPQPLMGVCDGDSSDSDAETISAGSYQDASSPGDSVGSSKENNQIPDCGFNATQNDESVDSLSSTNIGKSQYESKKTSDADEDPTRILFQGKAMHSEAPIKTREAVDQESSGEHSEDDEPTIMARDASEKTSTMINGKEKGSYVLMEMVEICRKPDQLFVSLLNVVAGSILLVITIRGILVVH